MVTELGMPFCVVLACDPNANGRALFKEVCSCPTILSGAPVLLNHICASGITSPMMGYLIHSHRYISTELTHRFWDIQAQSSLNFGLSAHSRWLLHSSTQIMTVTPLALTSPSACVLTVGYSAIPQYHSRALSGSCRLIFAILSNTETDCRAFEIKTPPAS